MQQDRSSSNVSARLVNFQRTFVLRSGRPTPPLANPLRSGSRFRRWGYKTSQTWVRHRDTRYGPSISPRAAVTRQHRGISFCMTSFHLGSDHRSTVYPFFIQSELCSRSTTRHRNLPTATCHIDIASLQVFSQRSPSGSFPNSTNWSCITSSLGYG